MVGAFASERTIMIYPWQQSQWKLFIQQYQHRHLHHAYLLYGQPGVGKLAFAHAMAHRLLCQEPGDTACGQCQHCVWSQSGEHPDLYELTPQEKSVIIKVDQVRQLVTDLAQSAHQGAYQVVIIHPAESLALSASNALLKTLEEPIGQIIFILVSDSPWRMLPTVRSRCLMLPCQLQSSCEAQAWLQEHISKSTTSSVSALLRAAHGAPLLALAYSERDYFSLLEHWLNDLNALATQSGDVVTIAAAAIKHDVQVLLAVLIDMLSDMMKLVLKVDQSHLIFQDQADNMRKMVLSLSYSQLAPCFDQAVKSRALLQTTTSVNAQLVIESWLIQWMQMFIK